MRTWIYGISKVLIVVLAYGRATNHAVADNRQEVVRPKPPDYCTLLTEAEAEAITGKPLNAPQTQPNGDCWYMKDGGSDFGDVVLMLTVQSLLIRSKVQFTDMVMEQAEKMNAAMKKAGMKEGGFEAEPVQDVGDAAYYLDPGLLVLVGDRVLNIVAPRSEAVLVAAKALGRLRS
jgi:hypothetical protein